MKSLSQALERMRHTLPVKESSADTLNTPPPGFTSEDGNSITQPQTQEGAPSSAGTALTAQESTKQTLPATPFGKPSQKWLQTVSSSDDNAENLGAFILVCFDGLNTFGKTPGQLKNAMKLFLMRLGDYPMPLVRAAFERWVDEKPEMPTPADIIGMMQEDNERLLDFVGYVRRGGNLTQRAEDYVISKLGKNWREIYV